jgi:cytochrome c biogenesis protein CcdA/thiol-disulfide isomerase/thioredoxin
MNARFVAAVFAAVLAMGHTIAMGQADRRTTWVEVTPLAEADAVHAGATVRLALQAAVAEGFHIQSNRPKDPLLSPALLTLDPPSGVSVTEIVFPESTDFQLKGSAQPNAVFERNFVVGVQLTIAKDHPPGGITIPARFRYQACDDTTCFKPTTLETQWTLRVVPAGAPASAQDRDVFSRIAFGHGEPPPAATTSTTASRSPSPVANAAGPEVLQRFDRFTIAGKAGGYQNVSDFLTFIHNAETGVQPRGLFEGRGPLAILALVFVGGLALNLTPCVLPMIPINLAIIGAGAQRARRSRGFLLGGTYGAAMALVYGVLGLIVILTAGTFGTINASPWFNLGIAALFVVLGLAMFDVLALDFSRWSSRIRFDQQSRGTFLLAFSMGAVAALLAGACVAPVVIQVVVFASNLYAAGTPIALALPFVLGLGMALPWPIAGAGLAALPKPGAWMIRVKQAMGVFILATAAYYGYLAYEIFANRRVDPASVKASVEEQLKAGWYSSLADGLQVAERNRTPVLVDFWATWCKNCLTMDKTTLADGSVKAALGGYTRIKFQAEDPDASPAKELMQRIGVFGLPAYVILRPN